MMQWVISYFACRLTTDYVCTVVWGGVNHDNVIALIFNIYKGEIYKGEMYDDLEINTVCIISLTK